MKRIVLPAIIFLALAMSAIAFAQTDNSANQPMNGFNTLLPPPTPQASTDQTANTSNAHIWNLRDVDIRTVIEEVSKDTGKNFIVDPRVQGKVTLISSSPMTGDELYQAFLAVLGTQGYTAVPAGNNIRIVPTAEANFQSVPAFIARLGASDENYVVQVVPVQNVNVSQLVPLLRPLLPASSQISAYLPTNALIATGTANKMAQIQQIVQNLDQPSASNIEIIPLTYAKASDVVTALKTLMPTNSTQTGVGLAADDGANSVLVSGPPSERARIQSLVQKLDVLNGSSTQQSAMTVIHLRYLKADDLVPVLRAIATGVPAPVSSTSQGASSNSNASAGAGDNSSDNNSAMSGSNYGGMNNPDSSDNSQPTNINYSYLSNYLNKMSANTNGQSQSSNYANVGNPNSNIQIDSEATTNSVIISAPPAMLRRLITLVHKLDTRPQQVLVEAIIVEINESDLQKLGVEWGSVLPSGVNMQDSFTTIVGAGLGVGVIDYQQIRILIHAIAQNSSTNILSTPSLVVLDNQEAKIKVGQKVSFTTGQYATSATQTTATPFTTADRQDVALQLSVTPQIGPNGTIRFLIKQANETLTPVISSDGNPVTNEQTLNTSVIMNNNQVLVLGGLISNDLEPTVSKIPILGDIPLLGRAFQYHSHTLDKKNLMIFIHPVILDDTITSNQQTSQRWSMMRDLQAQAARNADITIPKGANPVMQPWQQVSIPAPFCPTS